MPYRPQVWTPPPSPGYTGVYAKNDALSDPELIAVGGEGPEDVVLDDDGGLFTTLADGRVVRVDLDGGPVRTIARTGGRPLGIEWLPDGDLLVCDAERGLLRVPLDGGTIEALVTHVDGERLTLTNNATVADDGTIWFTESTRNHGLDEFTEDVLEHNGTGRLLRRDPDGSVETVFSGMSFANGVTLTKAQDAVLVTSSGDHTVWRIPVTGPDAGDASILRTALPGYTDNLSTGPDGTVWLAVVAPRNPLADLLASRPGILRRTVARIPERLRPKAELYAHVLGLDPDTGEVRHNLQGDGERYSFVTGVRAHDGWLYLASLGEGTRHVARVPLPS